MIKEKQNLLLHVSGPIFFLFALFFICYWSYSVWKTSEISRVVDLVSSEHPRARPYLYKTGTNWVRKPWEAVETNNEKLSKAIIHASEIRLESLILDAEEPSQNLSATSKNFLSSWWVHRNLCSELNQTGKYNENCNSDHIASIPPKIRSHVAAQVVGGKYLDIDGFYLKLLDKPMKSEVLCNLTPLSVDFETIQYLAKEDTIGFYKKFFDLEIEAYKIHKTTNVVSGACATVQFVNHGIGFSEPNLFHSTRYSNKKNGRWFQNVWDRYHISDFLSQDQISSMKNRTKEMVEIDGVWSCGHSPNESIFVSIEYFKCEKGEKKRGFLPSRQAKDGRGFSFAATLGLTDQSEFFSSNGRLIDRTLNSALSDIRDYSRFVKMRMYEEQAWESKRARFFLTNNDYSLIRDYNGPLKAGVQVNSLPQKSILGEDLFIPQNLNLLGMVSLRSEKKHRLNPTYEVFGVSNVFQGLHEHGTNEKAGIMKAIGLVGTAGASTASKMYIYRHRFNGNAYHDFPTDNPTWTGLKAGFSFGLGGWEIKQERAYYQQFYAKEYEAGEFLSFFVPIGPAMAGRIAKIYKGGKASKRIISGGIEGLLAAAYPIATAPPLQSKEYTFKQAETGAKFGFVFGILFPTP